VGSDRVCQRHLRPRQLSFAALALAAAALWEPMPATADTTAVARFDCEQGVCGFNVVDAELVVEPCAGGAVLVAYHATGGTAIVQCGGGSGPDEPTSYVFDRSRRGPTFEVPGGRFVRPAALVEAAALGVPDRFGPVPLCRPGAARAAEAASPLQLLLKTPAADGSCYRVLSVLGSGHTLALLADDSSPPLAPADVLTRRRWAALVDRMLPLIAH